MRELAELLAGCLLAVAAGTAFMMWLWHASGCPEIV